MGFIGQRLPVSGRKPGYGHFRLIFLSLRAKFLIPFCILLVSSAASVLAQDILIYRPINHAQKEVTTPAYRFRVLVTAMAPLKKITINGRSQTLQKGTSEGEFTTTLNLQPGKNQVVVDATTELETASQTFVIHLRRPGEKAASVEGAEKKAFRMIALLGAQKHSNPAKLPDSAEPPAGTRGYLILVTQYDLELKKDSTLRFQGIFSRDDYKTGDETERVILQPLELAFNQLSINWLMGAESTGQWNYGLGYATIDQEFRTLAQGRYKVENDLFLNVAWKDGLGEKGFYGFGLEIRRQNMNLGETDPEKNPDGLLHKLEGMIEGDLLGGRSKAILRTLTKLSEGKQARSQSQQLHLSETFAFSWVVPVLSYRMIREKFMEEDTTLGVVPSSTTRNISATANFPLGKSFMIMAEAASETRKANHESREYSNTSTNLAFVYIF